MGEQEVHKSISCKNSFVYIRNTRTKKPKKTNKLEGLYIVKTVFFAQPIFPAFVQKIFFFQLPGW